MRVAVLGDYHRVFDADPAVQRLRQRVAVVVYTDRLARERLRPNPILIALRERTRFDSAFFEARGAVAIVEAYLDGEYTGAVNPDALQHRKAWCIFRAAGWT
jgi:hypothetical protein